MDITPEALDKSNFRKIKLADILSTDCDECFYFVFPPCEGSIAEANGDGHLLEIWSWNNDYTEIEVEPHGRNIRVTPDTNVYVR